MNPITIRTPKITKKGKKLMLVLVAIEVVPITAGEEFERVRYGTCIGG